MSIEEEGLSSGGNAGLDSPDVGSSLDTGGNMGMVEQMQHKGALAGYLDQYATGSFNIGPQEEAPLRESVGGLDDLHLQRLSERQFDVYAEAVQDQNDLGQMVQIYAGLAKDVPQGVEPPSSEVVVGWQGHLAQDAHTNDASIARTEHIMNIVGGAAQERGQETRSSIGDDGRLFALLANPQTGIERKYNADVQKHNEIIQKFLAIDTASLNESIQNVARQYAEVEADPREYFHRASQRKQPSTPGERAVQAVEDYAQLQPMADVQEAYMNASPEERQRILQQMRDALSRSGVNNIVPVDADGVLFFRREGGSLRAIDYAYSSLLMEGQGLVGPQKRTIGEERHNRPLTDDESIKYVEAFLQMLKGKASVLQILRNFQEHRGERSRANIDHMKEMIKRRLREWPLERVQMFLAMLYGVRAAMYIKTLLLGEKGKSEGTEDSSKQEVDAYIDVAKEVILEKEEERNREKGRGRPEA